MKYRAKVTWIQKKVFEYYGWNYLNSVRDQMDTYLEVDTPEEADCLERMNKAEHERQQAEMDLAKLLNI